ncbi:hypothetical protein L1987_57886 [Smallanthus sonchifolius]|uniref:Uncharacterized protein n=1 Tax=Smallanthus sonchifolius TaxID=185202 RepID=A0ACB9DE88_9ASTR|nr:hypothetical protein L1987_57886 [Smallanthus sonchifolius]
MMQKYFLMRALSFLCYRTPSSFNAPNPNYKTPSLGSFGIHNFYTSKSGSSSENPNNHHSENEIHDVDDVSSAELKTQIDNFYKGDFEAIPAIFESILKRKLAGKHQDSDDELMNEFRQGQPNEVIDDFSCSSDSDDE